MARPLYDRRQIDLVHPSKHAFDFPSIHAYDSSSTPDGCERRRIRIARYISMYTDPKVQHETNTGQAKT